MEPRRITFHNEHLDLLKTLGQAACASDDILTFEYQPLSDYPFGWLLHPGLRDGLTVIDSAPLLALEHIGLIQRGEESGDPPSTTVTLTADGIACYSRSLGGSTLPSTSDGDRHAWEQHTDNM